MTNKRLKKLLMAKGAPRNEANKYVEELKRTHEMSKEELLKSVYVMKKNYFFVISSDWIDSVDNLPTKAELLGKKTAELIDRGIKDD